MRNLEAVIVAYSVISCFFSLVVIGTILFFPAMTKGNLMPIILYMSVADFFMNVASSFGFPPGGSVLCWVQGIAQNYFALSSWFWTTILAYRVYCGVRYGKCLLTLRQMQLIGWVLPVILTLLPITTTNYGSSTSNSQWCVLAERGNNSPDWLIPFWSYVTYFAWLFLCILCMLTWQAVISVQFRNSPMRDVIRRTYDKVYLYPVAMIICWTLNYWCDDLAPSSGKNLNAVSMAFGISNGVFAAIIFMVKSEEAQRRWMLFLFPIKQSAFDKAVEPVIRLDFEEDTTQEGGTESSGTIETALMKRSGLLQRMGSFTGMWARDSEAARESELTVTTKSTNPIHL